MPTSDRPRRCQESLVAHSAELWLHDVVLPVLPDITATAVAFRVGAPVPPIDASSLEGIRTSPFDSFYYGGVGTPTTEALSQAIARLEGGSGAVLTPSGQAAIALALLSFTQRGDHVLVTKGLTYTTRWLFENLAKVIGFDTTYFDESDVRKLRSMITSSTRLIFVEVPTSVVFKIFDLGEIIELGRAARIAVVLDTTWSASHYLRPFALGADATVLSLAKMHAGTHGVSLGAVVVKSEERLGRLRQQSAMLGLHVAPNACARASAAIVSLSARLAFQEATLTRVLGRIRGHPKIRRIYHPTEEEGENAKLWRRYFTGAIALISLQLVGESLLDVEATISRLRLIQKGYGWGGAVSLCQAMQAPDQDDALADRGWLLRLYLGLENADDLAADLIQAIG
jgi:cysteine-S-conjugate beta-lyase